MNNIGASGSRSADEVLLLSPDFLNFYLSSSDLNDMVESFWLRASMIHGSLEPRGFSYSCSVEGTGIWGR